MDERLAEAIRERLEDGKLPCNQAHAIAQILALDPLTVGFAASLRLAGVLGLRVASRLGIARANAGSGNSFDKQISMLKWSLGFAKPVIAE